MQQIHKHRLMQAREGQGIMVFTLSGQMKAEEVAELKALFDADYRTIVWTYET
ncbi:MAG TPA: hypothetical protein VN956_10725 [Pyrinomonadaceae bacterium]|nr:hypothetical protein [Pyrinomonadaceae bacterium]